MSETAGTPWSSAEIDLIVADYFDMLRMELRGEPFVKSHRNASIRELIDRSAGSIEYKHQNISAVLEALGEPWVRGYKPARNFQNSLIDGVERFLSAEPVIARESPVAERRAFEDESPIYFSEAPAIADRDEQPEHLKRLVRKFDPAARDERNRALGEQGERRIFEHERARLNSAGRDDLARKVRWVSKEDGDGAGYDILSFDPTGSERWLEVKTTTGHERTPFYLSENERLVSEERPDAFRIVRLYDFARDPRAFQITPPLESAVILNPQSYRATFG